MQPSDQGIDDGQQPRYQMIPRTLIFVTSTNPESGGVEVLLLKGAANKRLWANKYNGLGGHVEADEDIHGSAVREFEEETGIRIARLMLRGVVNIHTGSAGAPGICMFVFHGKTDERTLRPSDEGMPEWIPVHALSQVDLVDDLYEVIPRALGHGPIFYGHYSPAPNGTMDFRFVPPGDHTDTGTT